jgi:RsiW-degrading membrane proteinase PrsW (M82 family)
MALPLIASIVMGFAPMLLFAWWVYWLDRYEKEPKVLLTAVFLWGAFIATLGALVFGGILEEALMSLTGDVTITNIAGSSVFAPIIEESLKGAAVLLVFLIFRQEFDSILDGIVYAGIVALGFAATENVLYFYNLGYSSGGWEGFWSLVFLRVVVFGWGHPFYTAFTGIGLALARLNKSLFVKIVAPLAGLTLAMLAHSFHNTAVPLLSGMGGGIGLLIGMLLDWSGWFFMFLVILYAINREQNYIKAHLVEEVRLGTLTPPQYYVAISAWRQMGARMNALFAGRLRRTARFYQLCAELAHKKEQSHHLGDEQGNGKLITQLRAEMTELSKLVSV